MWHTNTGHKIFWSLILKHPSNTQTEISPGTRIRFLNPTEYFTQEASAEVASAISSRSEELTSTSGKTDKPWLEEMTPASVNSATEERPQTDVS